METYGTQTFTFGLRSIGAFVKGFPRGYFYRTAVQRLTDALYRGAELIIRELEDATRTWDTEVEFDTYVSRTQNDFSLTITTDSKIFRFVNDGTSIRYAVMTEDFIPKTMPNITSSVQGRGGFSYIPKDWATRKNAVYPKPGIEARNFIDTAFNAYESEIRLDMQEEFSRTAEESWNMLFNEIESEF